MSLYMLHPYTFILGGSAAIVFFYYYSNRWGTKAGRLGAALAVFFCGCAAAQIEIMQGTHREVIDRDKESRLYIDVSDSIPIELGELFLEVAKKNAAITEIIPFAGSVGAPILGDGASVSFQKLRSKFSPEDLHSTNLEPVILKMCNLTIGTRAILATDGEETKGSFERALVNCNTEAAVTILSVPRPPSIDEFTITNLNVPTHVDLSVQPKIR